MDDYQETRLHEPDPPPAERKALKRKRAVQWALYAFVAVVATAAVLASAWPFI